MDEALVNDDIGDETQLLEQPPHDGVRDVAAVGIIGVDQDDGVGAFALNQFEVCLGSNRKSSSLRRTLKTTWVLGG